MNNDSYAPILVFIILLFVGTSIAGVVRVEQLRNERNDLVLQMCDYSRVASTDTVTELCTKFQQQTGKEYFCNTKNECKVE